MHVIASGILSKDLLISLGIAIALGSDAFAVGLGLGTKKLNKRQSFRLWFHFGLFQFMMTFIGWNIGCQIHKLVYTYADIAAFTLLSVIAFKMIYESLKFNTNDSSKQKDGDEVSNLLVSLQPSDPTRGLSLVALSIATSLDAFGVGFGLCFKKKSILFEAIIIGLVASLMTYFGIMFGNYLSESFGKKVEILGGIVLLFVAVSFLLD